MCHKLFIFKEFYFLIFESNVKSDYKYPFKWVITFILKKNEKKVSYYIQKSKSLKLMNIKKLKKMDNILFLPNNIFKRLFKELKNIIMTINNI